MATTRSTLDDVFNAVGDFVEGSGIETEVAPQRDRLPPDDDGSPGRRAAARRRAAVTSAPRNRGELT